MSDPFSLDRFVQAQDPVIDDVLNELRRGRKASHWMWFVFPQIKGLGSSWMAERYAIASRTEAEAYLAHPVLGPRLEECTRLANGIVGRTAQEIFGGIDALKFRSSMTLFAAVAPPGSVFAEALNKFYGGEPDSATLRKL